MFGRVKGGAIRWDCGISRWCTTQGHPQWKSHRYGYLEFA